MKKLKRNLYILKCRMKVKMYHLIERVLHTLSTWGLIIEHKKDYTQVLDDGNVQTAPDLKNERFVFSVSYIIRKIVACHEYWFTTRGGKKIYVVYDSKSQENRLSFRAYLRAFYCHFSHKHRMWVHRDNPKVVIQTVPPICTSWIEDSMVKFETHTCDFSKCRYALEISLAKDSCYMPSEEVLSESYKVLGNSLTSKIPEINKTLTGAENDGNLTSPSKCPLVDNHICRKCGYPVFATPLGKYLYECIHHGEIDFHDIERVDPRKYERVLSNCLSELEHFCECPQDNTFRC